VREAVRDLIAAGMPRTDAVKRVAREAGRDRREVYQLAISLRLERRKRSTV
jgi:hypothetical protein